jgi:AmiR/NasT family two-component response regulator
MNAQCLDPILVVDLDLSSTSSLWRPSLQALNHPIIVASTTEQALSDAHRLCPYLVLLVGEQIYWTGHFVRQLRLAAGIANTTVMALTDDHTFSWISPQDNPGLDGFLVKPLSADILLSLIASACAKKACRAGITAVNA